MRRLAAALSVVRNVRAVVHAARGVNLGQTGYVSTHLARVATT